MQKVNSIRIAILAFSVKGAMGHYLYCWLKNLGKHGEVILFCPEHFCYAPENFIIKSFKTNITQWRSGLRLLNYFAAKKVGNLVISEKPDIVHLFNGVGYPWSIIVSNQISKAGIPLVTTIHDPLPHLGELYGRFDYLLRKKTINRSDCLHLHTKDGKRILTGMGYDPKKIFIIPIGNAAELFLKFHKQDTQREDMVLFFGRIAFYKGIDVFLEASKILGSRFKYVIAGPGKFSFSDKKFLRDAPRERYEIYNCYLNDSEVAALFCRAKVCVLPYRDATQSIIPALSASFGVPVVATAVGGFREDIPKINGILVTANDSGALANGVLQAIDRKVRYPKELEFEHLAPEFISIYRSLIKEKIKSNQTGKSGQPSNKK